MNKTHHVVVLNWASDEVFGCTILGVGDTYDEALSVFNEHIANEKEFAVEHDYTIVTDSEGEFEAKSPTDPDTDYITLYIKKVGGC